MNTAKNQINILTPQQLLAALLFSMLLLGCDTSGSRRTAFGPYQPYNPYALAGSGSAVIDDRGPQFTGDPGARGDFAYRSGLGQRGGFTDNGYFPRNACTPCSGGRPVAWQQGGGFAGYNPYAGGSMSWGGFGASQRFSAGGMRPILPPYFYNSRAGTCPVYNPRHPDCGERLQPNAYALSTANHLHRAGQNIYAGNVREGYHDMALAREAAKQDDGLIESVDRVILETDEELSSYLAGEPYYSGEQLGRSRHNTNPYHAPVPWGYLLDDLSESLISFNYALERGVFNVAHGVTHRLRGTLRGIENQTYLAGFQAYRWDTPDDYFAAYGDINPQCCPY